MAQRLAGELRVGGSILARCKYLYGQQLLVPCLVVYDDFILNIFKRSHDELEIRKKRSLYMKGKRNELQILSLIKGNNEIILGQLTHVMAI